MASIYSEEYQQLIKTLRDTRAAKGITQQKLAQAMNRPQLFIAKIESGERRLEERYSDFDLHHIREECEFDAGSQYT